VNSLTYWFLVLKLKCWFFIGLGVRGKKKAVNYSKLNIYGFLVTCYLNL